ncbi:hypothetical protein E2562_030168 [Oryza meyeriana var. granulata]|uniref:GHMP kinase C-terminal domain-containing protein n=1 Tax=Oryza meyeriana var. granulata TaxID=110450 RepID=A0A6G1BPH5_9ORYZ|nr:hypothetical protein E2562_030168 [Oryza meyeriana var. granulata]
MKDNMEGFGCSWPSVKPNIILDAEKELGIVAGLQDRVAQCISIPKDIGNEHMDTLGHGVPKFGGAVVALCPDGEAQVLLQEKACQDVGFLLQRIQVAPSPLPLTEENPPF